MRVLYFDTETSGLDPKTCLITEVGAILVEGGIETRLSELVWDPCSPPLPENIIKLTGIDNIMLERLGRPLGEVFSRLIPMVEQADVILAHKAAFDRGFFNAACNRLGIEPPLTLWICTINDFDWDKKYKCRHLSHLCFDHGLDFKADFFHRAINDCVALSKLIGCYDFEKFLNYAKEPWVMLRGDVAGPWTDGGVQNGIAKSNGFSWEKVNGDDRSWPKQWVSRVKASRVEALKEVIRVSVSPFRVSIIND